MNAHRSGSTRILVGASSYIDASAAMRLLGRLMGTWQPSLGGVLIEDTESLAICSLPDRRIVTPSGTVVLAPSLSQIRTLIEADARAFRQSLARLAEDAGAPWTFERDRGDLIQTGLRMARAWDVLVIAHRNLHPVAGKVVLMGSPETADSPIMMMSKRLSARLNADPVILTVDTTTRQATAPKPFNRHSFATFDQALAQLARLNTQAVLVDMSRGPVRTAEDLHRIIDVARCPVFVFGTVSAARSLEHTMQIPPGPNTPEQNR